MPGSALFSLYGHYYRITKTIPTGRMLEITRNGSGLVVASGRVVAEN